MLVFSPNSETIIFVVSNWMQCRVLLVLLAFAQCFGRVAVNGSSFHSRAMPTAPSFFGDSKGLSPLELPQVLENPDPRVGLQFPPFDRFYVPSKPVRSRTQRDMVTARE